MHVQGIHVKLDEIFFYTYQNDLIDRSEPHQIYTWHTYVCIKLYARQTPNTGSIRDNFKC